MKYGVICAKNAKNIGDDIQTYAASRFLPNVDYYIEREEISDFRSKDDEPVAVIMNAWWMWKKYNWPPSRDIIPNLTSMHFTNWTDKNWGTPITYEIMDGIGKKYFNSYGPVGARDYGTMEELKKHNIKTYFSGCLTLTLPKQKKIKKDVEYICLVDVDDLVINKISDEINNKNLNIEIKIMHHDIITDKDRNSWKKRMKNVEDLLTIYQNAKCVVTSRLHAALPCLAMETPVVIVRKGGDYDSNSPRFKPYSDMCSYLSVNDFISGKYDVFNPPKNKNIYLKVRNELIKQNNNFIKKVSTCKNPDKLFKLKYSVDEEKKMKKLNITFCSFPDYSGNAKALYEYMNSRYKDNMNYTWIVYDKKSVENLRKQGINSIQIGTNEFKKYIPKTDVFFTTQGNLDADKIKAKNSIYIELWHGIGPKPIGFLQKNPSEDDLLGYSNISNIVDYFVVPSDFWKVIWGAIFKVESRRILPLGLPLLDYFNNSNGKDKLSTILKIDLSQYKKVIMYMPTFKNAFNHSDVKKITSNIFNFDKKYSEKELNDFLKKNDYLLIVKKHPAEQTKLKMKSTSNIIIMDEDLLKDNLVSINEIINGFDMLITDYSSIGTEYIYLNKPILFAAGNLIEYQENRGFIFGKYDMWTPGPVCDNIEDLCSETKKLLDNSKYFENERIKAKKLWFGDRNDGGCAEICDFLFDNYKISDNVVRVKSDFTRIVDENRKLKRQKIENDEKISQLGAKNAQITEQLEKITNSKGWKFLEKIRSIKRKILKK